MASANPYETATDAGLVEGHTPFTGYLLRALQGAEETARDPVTGLLTAASTAAYVQSSVAAYHRNWQGPQTGILPGDGGGVLVWQVQAAIDILPGRLRRGLTSEVVDTRYLAIESGERLLADPKHGSAVHEVLEEMAWRDPDPEVRHRALKALGKSEAATPPPAVRPTSPLPTAVEPAPEPEPAPVSESSEAAVTQPISRHRPARGGISPLVLAGGAVVGVAVLVGGLALAGVFAPAPAEEPPVEEEAGAEAAPAEAVTREEEEEAAPAEAEAAPETEPVLTPGPALQPTLEPTDTPVPIGFIPVTANDQWTLVTQFFDAVEMALVPAGCFMMSGDGRGGEQCFEEPFWIDVYEVTNEQYGSEGEYSGPNRPRERVTWFEAVTHCEFQGARLPTEAEWEYAARGPDGLEYPWGDNHDWSLANFCDVFCMFDQDLVDIDDGYETTAPVGSYPDGASWVGAYDMSGNVWEWVSTIYDEDRFPYPYSPDDGREVDGSRDRISLRVLRSSSWASDPGSLHAISRRGYDPVDSDFDIGFRCARSFYSSEF
jgi:formylglycine-generating enzyme required for sulfatase activity